MRIHYTYLQILDRRIWNLPPFAKGTKCIPKTQFSIFPTATTPQTVRASQGAGGLSNQGQLSRFGGMKVFRVISKLLIGILALWGVYASVLALFGVSVYFPLRLADAEPIPYHRWQTVRITVFLTFAYFSIIHLLNGSREMYPIKFLEVYLTILTLIGAVIFVQQEVEPTEYLLVLFFGVCAFILHMASRPTFRRYFSRK